MRTDGARESRRPRGVVLRPLALLLAGVLTGFGMWHVLMQDGARKDHRLAGQGRFGVERLVRTLNR